MFCANAFEYTDFVLMLTSLHALNCETHKHDNTHTHAHTHAP